MPHAEAADFDPNLTVHDAYASLISSLRSLVDTQRNWVCNTANAAALLWHMYQALPRPRRAVNWAGFYVLDTADRSGQSLILGPFQGKVACQSIRVGSGVCGAAAATAATVLVPDVHAFPGHIACDGASQSEIVVPVVRDGKVVAVIDIDCAELNGFDEEDQRHLEAVALILAQACDW